MDILRTAFDAEYREPGLRTGLALDPLHSRPDFRLPMLDLAFPAEPFVGDDGSTRLFFKRQHSPRKSRPRLRPGLACLQT